MWVRAGWTHPRPQCGLRGIAGDFGVAVALRGQRQHPSQDATLTSPGIEEPRRVSSNNHQRRFSKLDPWIGIQQSSHHNDLQLRHHRLQTFGAFNATIPGIRMSMELRVDCFGNFRKASCAVECNRRAGKLAQPFPESAAH